MDPSSSSGPGEALNLPIKRALMKREIRNNHENDELKSLFDLLKSGEENIKLSDEYRNVTLVLGNTGSGKSTFTQWIAGDNSKLISKEVTEGTGEYIIEDNNRIGNSTIKSKTVFPELVVSNRTNMAFYDCPGFSDTRSMSNDIATTYFIKNVLDFADSIKIVLTVSYPSVRKGVDRQNFMKLVRHVTDLVKDIDKFKQSIAIVATKVDNRYVKSGNSFKLVKDDQVIKAIADFFQEVKTELAEKNSSSSVEKRKFYENATKFINILLSKDGEHFSNIGIFRRPDSPGPLNNIMILQEGKMKIEQILDEILTFTTTNDDDFGYTISEKSKNDINDIADSISANLWSTLSVVREKIQVYYESLIGNIRDRIQSFVNRSATTDADETEAQTFSVKFRNGFITMSDLIEKTKNLTNLEDLGEIIRSATVNLDADTFRNEVLNIQQQGRYFNFLQIVKGKNLSMRPWPELFQSTFNYLSESKKNIEDDIIHVKEKLNDIIQSDLEITARAIKEHYQEKMKETEIQILPDMLSMVYNEMVPMTEKFNNLTSIDELLRIIKDTANNLNVELPQDNIRSIANQGKHLQFLKILSETELNILSAAWLSPVKVLTEYINESLMWYKFLNSLYEKLSEYEIQNDTKRYNVANLDDWGKSGKSQGIAITKSNFEKFLSKTAMLNVSEGDSIKNIQITDLQLEELNYVLILTLKHQTEFYFNAPNIFITGNYINVKDVTSQLKQKFVTEVLTGKLKTINIFSSNKIFLNEDIASLGVGLPITFIAPKWEIIGNRRINLNGVRGEPHQKSKAANGTYSKAERKGEDGKPGNPGRQGGTFYGIGETFVNGSNLEIFVNGGNGGPGQDGGNGLNGKDGRDPILPSAKEYQCKGDYTVLNGFKCERIEFWTKPFTCRGGSPIWPICDAYTCYSEYKMIGIRGDKGGDAGNGGKRGKGGNAGRITIVELGNESGIWMAANKGRDGIDGKAGIAGIGGSHGNDMVVSYLFKYMEEPEIWKIKRTLYNGRAAYGKNGVNGKNEKDLLEPIAALTIDEPYKIINAYKNYLRENLKDRFKKKILMQFFYQLDSNRNVRNAYNTGGFIDELQDLEQQFYKLNQCVDFIPFYKSLLSRIILYAKNPKNDEKAIQYKKVLNYLYTAVLSRIYDIEDSSEFNLIIDISGYLNLAEKDIVILKDLQRGKHKSEVINKHKKVYKNSIDNKIKEAKMFIQKQITPEIDNIHKQIDENIELLIDETIDLQKKAEKEKESLVQKKLELENTLAFRGLFGFIQTIGQVISFLGPIGAALGTVLETTTSVSESLILDNQGQILDFPKSFVPTLRSLKDQIKSVKSKKIIHLNKLLEEISKQTGEYPEKLADVSSKVTDIRMKLKNIEEKKFDLKDVGRLENEVKEELKRKEMELKSEKDVTEKKTAAALNVIEKLTKVARLGSSLIDINIKIMNDKSKIDVINQAIEEADGKFEKLKDYEGKIYSTIIPLLQDMEDNIQGVANKLDAKSQVALDVTKWQVQDALRDMKLQMQQITEGFEMKDNLARCIEKLEEVMITLINIYDRLQNYQEQQNLADYIADISSTTASNININVPVLISAVNRLEIMLRSNLILKRYKTVLKAFKQWLFPFADHFLEKSMLPSNFESSGSIEDLVYNAISQIDHMKLKVDEYKTSVKINDRYIQSGEFNSFYVSTKPFYVWKNDHYKSILSELLSGLEVVLKADVRNSASDKDAIKFSSIELYLKSVSGTSQTVINNKLKGFDIRATHLGNSYYRYNDEIYSITSESQTIQYSFEKNSLGKPLRRNKVYEKIEKGDLMLSPYAIWLVKLINSTREISFQELLVYKDDIDLELSGYGSYVDKDISTFKFMGHEYKNINEHYELSLSKCKAESSYNFSSTNNQYFHSVLEVGETDYVLRNSALGLSSPINYLCNLIKQSTLLMIFSPLTIMNKEQFLKNDHDKDNCHKMKNGYTEEGYAVDEKDILASIDQVTEVIKDETRDKVKIIESVSPFEEYGLVMDVISNEQNYIPIDSYKFQYHNDYSKPSLQNDQSSCNRKFEYFNASEINSSLLLADLVSRSLTGEKYYALMKEPVLTPQAAIEKKINSGIVRNEYDVQEYINEFLHEADESEQSSLFSKVKQCAISTLQFIGLLKQESVNDYICDIRGLFY